MQLRVSAVFKFSATNVADAGADAGQGRMGWGPNALSKRIVFKICYNLLACSKALEGGVPRNGADARATRPREGVRSPTGEAAKRDGASQGASASITI